MLQWYGIKTWNKPKLMRIGSWGSQQKYTLQLQRNTNYDHVGNDDDMHLNKQKRGWYHNDLSENRKYGNAKQIQKNLNDVDGEDDFARHQLDSTTITPHIWKVTMMIGMKKIKWNWETTQWVQITINIVMMIEITTGNMNKNVNKYKRISMLLMMMMMM